MVRNNSSPTLAALTSLFVIAACGAGNVTPPPDGQATLMVTADVSATTAAMVVVEVTGPGIPTPLVFNLGINSGVASGAITIPVGTNRVITVRAFDASTPPVETHEGTATVNVQAGNNTTVSLTLTPLTGEVPVSATVGSITVAVAPSTITIAIGATTTFTATITGATGTPTPRWATRDPGIASVGTDGVVTGVGAGTTTIVATFQGVAGAATVTVQ